MAKPVEIFPLVNRPDVTPVSPGEVRGGGRLFSLLFLGFKYPVSAVRVLP